MKTYMANPDKIERKWYVVDAEGCTLGRLSSEIAKVLRGKNKPEYTPHVDTGDYVIVVNADKVKVTGKKKEDCRVVVNGAGSAGVAITKLLLTYGFPHITMCDINGIISKSSPNLNWMQQQIIFLEILSEIQSHR